MKTTPRLATACRWTARAMSILLLAVITLIAIGEHMPLPFSHGIAGMSALAVCGLGGFLFLVLGLAGGWFCELWGGLMLLVGVVLLLWPTYVNGRVTWFFAALAAPGILYIASALIRERAAPEEGNPPVPPAP